MVGFDSLHLNSSVREHTYYQFFIRSKVPYWRRSYTIPGEFFRRDSIVIGVRYNSNLMLPIERVNLKKI